MATDADGVDQQRHARAGGGRQWGRNETPTRDYGNKRQQQEMAETGDSRLATMTVAAYSDFRGWQWQRMTMALINNGTQELAADNEGEGTRAFGIY